MRTFSRTAAKASCVAICMMMAAPVVAADVQAPKLVNPATLKAPDALEKPEAGKLIGHRVENLQGQRIGEIEAIHINRNGKVEDVIVGVGGFLGIGERDVSIKWKSLNISADGAKVTTDASKAQLKAMPAYTFPMPEYRKTVFSTPPL